MTKQKNSRANMIFWDIVLGLNLWATSSYFIEDIKNPDMDTSLVLLFLALNTALAGYTMIKETKKYANATKNIQQQR
jgi:hypothetical protein